ncbi:MAG: hypothetical protein KBD01_08055 [Acidobacteria bacterium]|nr:hypothetical protein [Acidobacteriota bacterium]
MRSSVWILWTVAAGLVLQAGCENDDASLVEVFQPPAGRSVSLSRDVQPIFTANCALAGCHDPLGAAGSAGLNLQAGAIYDPALGIVGVASAQAPGVLRVAPGDADASYLVHKLEGTQGSVGGEGERMPSGAEPLPDAAIAVIREWIDDGAPNN